MLVFLAAKSGLIKNSDDAADVQNVIICIEMAVAEVGHLYAFPYKEYVEANIGSSGGLADSVTHALNFNDVYYDTVHQVMGSVFLLVDLWIVCMYIVRLKIWHYFYRHIL